MSLHIIHLPGRSDRLKILHDELASQKINDFILWEGIIDSEGNSTKAISRAHKQIVRHAKIKNLTEVMIAEDDIHFTSAGSFNYFLKTKPATFDLYLASVIWGKVKDNHTVTDFSGLTLYIVNQSFYNTFLSIPEEIDLDRALNNKGIFHVCEPFIAIQHPGYSDHKGSYCDYSDYLKNSILFDKDSHQHLKS